MGDALLTAANILIRVPSKTVLSTPYELLTSNKLELAHWRPCRSIEYILTTSNHYGKSNTKSNNISSLDTLKDKKCYVILDEQADKGVTEIGFHNADILKRIS